MEGFQQKRKWKLTLPFLPMNNVGFNLMPAAKIKLIHHNENILRIQNQLSTDIGASENGNQCKIQIQEIYTKIVQNAK